MKKNCIILFVGILLTSILLTGTAIAVDDISLKDLNVKISSFNTVKSNDNVTIIVKVTDKGTKEKIVRANVHLSIPGIIDITKKTNYKGKAGFKFRAPKLSVRTTKTITVTASATGYNTATKTKQITIKPAIEGITLKLKMPKTVKEGQMFFARAIVIDKATKQRVPGATVLFTPGRSYKTTNNLGMARTDIHAPLVSTDTTQKITATATYNGYTVTKSKTITIIATNTKKLDISEWVYPEDTNTLGLDIAITSEEGEGEVIAGTKVVVKSLPEDGQGEVQKLVGYTNEIGLVSFSLARQSNKDRGIRQKVVITATKAGYTKDTIVRYYIF